MGQAFTADLIRGAYWAIIVALILILILPLNGTWSVALLGVHLLLCAVELLNSAIEAVVDLASPEQHPLAKKAKDCGSAAVLAVCLILVLCWCAALATMVG